MIRLAKDVLNSAFKTAIDSVCYIFSGGDIPTVILSNLMMLNSIVLVSQRKVESLNSLRAYSLSNVFDTMLLEGIRYSGKLACLGTIITSSALAIRLIHGTIKCLSNKPEKQCEEKEVESSDTANDVPISKVLRLPELTNYKVFEISMSHSTNVASYKIFLMVTVLTNLLSIRMGTTADKYAWYRQILQQHIYNSIVNRK